MAELFTDFVAWVSALSPFWVYTALLLISYGENIVPFIPGDLFIAFCGYLAGLGQVGLGATFVIATIGGTLGFMSMYALGYRAGNAVLDPQRLRWIPKRQARRVRRWVRRWGYAIVAANRFLSGARSVISLTVGMARMHVAPTAIWSGVSSAVWSGLIIWAGYALGSNWEAVGGYLAEYARMIIILMALAVLAAGVRFLLRRRKKATWQQTLDASGTGATSSESTPAEVDTPH